MGGLMVPTDYRRKPQAGQAGGIAADTQIGGFPMPGGGGGSVGGGYVPVPGTIGSSVGGPPPSAPAAPSTTSAPSAPGTQTNTAQTNPELQSFLNSYKTRLAQVQGAPTADPNLQTQVDRLGQRLSADTTNRAIDRAGSAIKDAAAGRQTALTSSLARRGLSGSGVEASERGKIAAQAQRAQAGAAADISLGRERDLDALTLGGQGIMSAPGQYSLAREGQTNNFLLGGLQAAAEPGRQALADRQLGLQQWQAQNAAEQGAQDRQLSQWLALMRMYGG